MDVVIVEAGQQGATARIETGFPRTALQRDANAPAGDLALTLMSLGRMRSATGVCVPSGESTCPRKRNVFPSSVAWPAIGVRQEPSRTPRNARSQISAVAVA